ncbi:MAG TPA: Ig-like domain-containing protein [Pseudoflavonifractor sp.]|nr:Ig-like domain-containing protein [Pseudoflavonifractor sp.]
MRQAKRTLAALLTVALLLGMLPAGAANGDGAIIEAENASPTTSGAWGIKETRNTVDVECSGGKFFFVQTPASPESDWAEFTLTAPAAGTYDIYVTTKDNRDRTAFQFSLDGTALGSPVDLFRSGAEGVYREHKIGTASLGTVPFKLRATALPKSPAGLAESLTRSGVFDFFRLVPAGEPEPGPTALYQADFSALPAELSGAEGWSLMPLKSGSALQGVSSASSQLLAALPSASGDLPDAYTVVLDMQLESLPNTAGYSGGLTFFHIDDQNFYHYRIDNGSKSTVQLRQWEDGTAREPIANTTLIGAPNGAHRLRVTVDGKQIVCYMDGQQTAAYTAAAADGQLGLRAYNSKALFDNLTVYEGVVPPPAQGESAPAFEPADAGPAVCLMTLNSAGVTKSDGWSPSSLTGSTKDSPSVYSGTVGQYVQFMPSGLAPGWYEVAFWNIAQEQSVMKMTGTVHTKQEDASVQPTAMTANGWNTVGAFYFSGTGDEYFRLTVTTAGPHSRVADVRFMETSDPGHESTVWHDEDSFFQSTGAWTTAASPNGSDGSGLHVTTELSATVAWSNYPPSTGNFGVYYWIPEAANGVTLAPLSFDISSLNGNWKVSLNPNGKPSGWTKLCTVSATAGTALSISMSPMGPGTAYADSIQLTGTSAGADPVYTPGGGGSDEIAVLVNQIGYDNGKPKRASVPNAANGMFFKVFNKTTGQAAFSGQVMGGIADFSSLETTADTDFYITCGPAQSYDFTIGTDLIQRRSVKNALAFMGETRSDTFKVGVAGIGWRDSHQFSFELNGMVLQYMANPSLYKNLPYGIPEAATCEYPELRAQDEPDLVWLIQFAALRYYDWGHTEGKQLHMLTKEQLAYYLYLYPEISQYVLEETYEAIRDYTISVWGTNECNVQWYGVNGTNHNLYSVQTVFGGLKGSQPPGHSIVPNLLMYEVAKRDGLGDEVAQRFFDAAYENCNYTITGIDINDPFYNKGQRMSEYITVPALAYFLELYPDQAPAGLKAALESWAEKTIARSNNQWDIRMAVSLAAGDGAYTFHNPGLEGQALLQDYWTGAAYANADRQSEYLSGGAPKNEPGNQAGLQAVTYAAARVLDDAGTKERLTELGVAAIDDLFGRNPTGRAAFYHFTRDFEGADLGWYMQYKGGNGLLGEHTAVIDANAPEACYPYAPQNYNTGYTEGWVAYNTAWNASLAYAAADAVSLSAPAAGAAGTGITISLRAPLNMDTTKAETGNVVVTNPLTGERTEVMVTETGVDSAVFEGVCTLPNAPYVTLSYGSGLFRQSVDVTVTDFTGTPVTGVTLSESSLSLSLGETLRLTAGVTPEDATDKRVSFTSSAPTAATVTADGLVRAVAAGSAVITAASVSNPSVKASCTVTVSAAGPQSLRLSVPATLSVFGPAGAAQVTGVVYSDGSVVTDPLPQAVFSTEPSGILRVTPEGVLTALAGGKATVTATAVVEGKTVAGSAPVTVTADTSYDLLTLYRENQYTTSGVTTAIAANTNDTLTPSYGGDRLKLTGNQAGNTVTFQLSALPAGTYSVTLYTKYYGGSWAYGVWSFQVDGKAVGIETDFDDPAKNGAYHDLPLGQVPLEGSGPHSFTFVSSDGGALVPVSLRFTLVSGEDPDPGVEPGQTSPKIHSMDEMYQKVYTDTAIQAKGLNYRLYIPASYEHGQAEDLPLLIYLNGAGSRGTDNVKQLANLSPLITPLIDNPDYPCILVVPQLPESDKWVNVDWANGSYADSVAESNSAKLLMGLIGELKEAYQVDESRVYLMGQSFGGYGTWDLITRHPETFAAAVPMCGAGSLARTEAIKDLPLLVLHGAADPTVPVSGSREMVAALQAAGSASVTYLEYPGDDHYVQRRLFEQPELYLGWLFSQEKGTAPTAPDVSAIYLPKLTLNLNSAAQLDRLTVTGGTAAIGGEQLTLTPADTNVSVLALVKDTGAFTDGLLTAHFTMEALTGSGGAGLVLRAQNDQSYVHLRFTKTGLNLLEMVGGSAQRSITVPYTLTGNRITCMKAELRGNALKVWVDNVLLYDTAIQAPILQTKGTVGVRSYGVPAKVDDLIWATRSGPSITFSSMVDRQVYQRDVKTGTASVTLAGTVSDTASLKARVVSWADESDVLLDWRDIPLEADGSFSTALTVPQGGWYKTQLAAYDSGGVKLTGAESNRWGVGINILCIGQSNMVGIGQGEAIPAHDLASNFMNEHWTHLEDPYDRGDTTPISSDGTTGNSMVPALANALIAEYGLPVGIIPAAKGGAGLVCDCADYPRWLDRTEGNPTDRSNLYGNSLYRAQAAGGVEFILMNQGEHDVSAGTGEEEYLAALSTLVSNYRTDLGWDVPFLYCQLGPAKAGSWDGDRAPYMDGIRAAQMRANDPANGVILAAVELDLGRNSDNLHYTTASQSVIGRRVANAIFWYYDDIPGKADYYTGPSIAGVHFADQSRAVIDVTLAHTGGGDFTPAEDITGFTVTDGGTPVAIASARQKDAHTITLTLEAPITGEGKVRYMAGLLPDVTGIVKDNSPMALPLNATVGALTVAEAAPPSITLTPTEATLYVNGENTLQLTAELSPAGSAAITWASSDEAVATVSSDGLVTAVSNGTATITASAGGASAQCTVTVETLAYSTPLPITAVTAPGGGAAVSIAPIAQTSGGMARAHLTASDASRLLSAAKKRDAAALIIVPKVRSEAAQVSVTLSAGAATTLAGRTLIFQFPGASITLPSGSLDSHEGPLTVTAARQADGTLTISTGLSAAIKAVLDAPEGNVAVQLLPDGTKRPLPFSLASNRTVTALIPGDAVLTLESRTVTFRDVPQANWAAESVSFLAVRDVINGTPNGSFAPETPMTRAMLATILARLDGVDAASPAGQPWYGVSLVWAVEQGILQGNGRDLAPEALLTREQLCTLLVRYLDHAGLTLELSETPGDFTDADSVSGWATDAVEVCLKAGLLTGKPGGRIDPQGKATRAEVSVILTRFIEKVLR